MKLYTVILSLLTVVMLTACNSTKKDVSASDTIELPAPVKLDVGQQSRAMPKAVIYKTNGDYNQNVMVTLNSDHSALVSYPDPTDVRGDVTPLEVSDGWLLDRRGGVGPNSAFLKYTYSEYAKLKKAPTMHELMESIIPGAQVTVFRVLPVSANEAIKSPNLVKSFIQ